MYSSSLTLTYNNSPNNKMLKSLVKIMQSF